MSMLFFSPQRKSRNFDKHRARETSARERLISQLDDMQQCSSTWETYLSWILLILAAVSHLTQPWATMMAGKLFPQTVAALLYWL